MVNASTLVSDASVRLWTQAIAVQLVEHLAPAWGLGPFMVECCGVHDEIDAQAYQIVLVDRTGVLGVLGYHDVDPSGNPYGRVDVGECHAIGVDVSTTLSHEVLETALDPMINEWRTDPSNGIRWALEACDQCENDSYEIDGVMVSDFILPAALDANAPAGSKRDWLGRLDDAFSIRPGGYAICMRPDGSTYNVNGSYAARPSKRHPSARTRRRGLVL